MPLPLTESPDYPTLTQLRSALFGLSAGRRAAVLVGAGFSRNAIRAAGDSALPPLWPDFEREMWIRLYPDQPVRYGNPLRLAEEFKVSYGQASLDDLIRDLVPDSTWEPGEAHNRLLALPWTDVLTTNWDTLLERAAQSLPNRRYGLVATVGDMAVNHAPRIVKLHGTLPSGRFVFTEEDYRRYHASHGPFVNLARQVFIENELVLIGFSGEDPNFLQWAGWVRDELQDKSRRLYIVGVFGFGASRRRLLESLNISVIDLKPCFSDCHDADIHQLATGTLLSFLEAGKPQSPDNWPYANFSERAPIPGTIDGARGIAERFRRRRTSYPGWLVCPWHTRWQIQGDISEAARVLEKFIANFSPTETVECLFEMAWLANLAGAKLPNWAISACKGLLVGPTAVVVSSGTRTELSLAIAQAARLSGDDLAMEEACQLLALSDAEGAAWSTFIRCLRLRDKQDLATLKSLVGKIKGRDPIWMVRKAGLHASTGNHREARSSLREALIDLRQRYIKEPGSLWIKTRLSWTEFLARLAIAYPEEVETHPLARISWSEDDFNVGDSRIVWSELETCRFDLHRSLKEVSAGPRTSFDPGVYSSSNTASWNSASLRWPNEIRFILDTLGTTGRFGHTSFFADEAQSAALLTKGDDVCNVDWALSTSHGARDNKAIEHFLRRSTLAVLSQSRIDELHHRFQRLAEFVLDACDDNQSDSDDSSFLYERLSLAFEVISRLSIRYPRETAILSHRKALAWAGRRALVEWSVHESYSRLLERTWKAIPPADRHEFAVAHLLFPLSSEITGALRNNYWPDPSTSIFRFSRPTGSAEWGQRFEALVDFAKQGDTPARKAALQRLFNFRSGGALNDDEAIRLSDALWHRRGSHGMPADTGMWDFIIFEVPAPQGVDIGTLYAKFHFVGPFKGEADWLHEVAGGSELARSLGLPTPTTEVATTWLDAVLDYYPHKPRSPFEGINDSAEKQIPGFIQHSILPFVTSDRLLQADFVPRISCLIERVPHALKVIPHVAKGVPTLQAVAEQIVHDALWSGQRMKQILGAIALCNWLDISGGRGMLSSTLANDIVALCAIPRHFAGAFLWEAAASLVRSDLLNPESTRRLIEALRILEPQAEYQSWMASDHYWEQEGTLVVAKAVRTAAALSRAGLTHPTIDNWTSKVNSDPMPEVRFALHDQELAP